jgi:hypothetical protein
MTYEVIPFIYSQGFFNFSDVLLPGITPHHDYQKILLNIVMFYICLGCSVYASR